MPTVLPIGKAHILTIHANMSDGSLNTTLPMITGSNQPTKIKAKINPSNSREVGVLALAATTGATVTSTVNAAISVQVDFQVPSPTLTSVTIGSDGGEIDPPQWLIDP